MYKQSKGKASLIQVARYHSLECQKSRIFTSSASKPKTSSLRTARRAMCCSSRTITSSQRHNDSLRDLISVVIRLFRSRGNGSEGRQLRPIDLLVQLRQWSLSHSLEIRDPLRLVQVHPQVTLTLHRISWRRLKFKRDKAFNDTVEKFILQNLQKNYHISLAKITAHQSVIRPV